MNIDELILRSEDIAKLCDGCEDEFTCGGCYERDKKAQLKLLEWLNKEGLLRHRIVNPENLDYVKPYCHLKDCRVCKLEAMLREV